ncbi:MAG: serine/threonine-protein kinase [Mycobacterium sp.]
MQGPEILGGRYQIRGVLGRGGMAEVRDGWDTRLARPVAIKLMYPALAELAEHRRRFEVEARAAAGLHHRNIVVVHDSGEHDGTPYIVMERLSGRTVAEVIAQGTSPWPQVRSLLEDVLSALAVAHASGILHRDIKPGNILLTDAGVPKVADFGIAKSPESGQTMTGQVVGTLGYLSPERLAGRPATPADDLYAVGVVAFEALVGRVPSPRDDLAALRPDVDPVLASVIQRAVAPDPRARFADADQMRAALAGRPPTLVLGSPLPDPATAVVPVPVPRSRRRKLIAIAGAAAAVIVLTVAFVLDTASRSSVAPTPAGTSTPPVPTQTAVPPPPAATTTPAVVQEPPAQRGNGNGNKGGNGNERKPKRGND